MAIIFVLIPVKIKFFSEKISSFYSNGLFEKVLLILTWTYLLFLFYHMRTIY
jgi:hypothetical protein